MVVFLLGAKDLLWHYTDMDVTFSKEAGYVLPRS